MRENSQKSAVLPDLHRARALGARAWLSIEVSRDIDLDLGSLSFITGFPGIDCHAGRVVAPASLPTVPASCYQVFEPVRSGEARAIRLREAHNRIRLHAWGDPDFTLAAGACRATLLDDDRLLQLRVGDLLMFEQVLGEASGAPFEADPGRRHAVRLTRVEAIICEGRELVAIEWDRADRLPFALPVACRAHPGAGPVPDLTVVRGNTLLVEHGSSFKESFQVGVPAAPLVHRLARSPLAFAEPFLAGMPAAAAFVRCADAARAQVSCIGIAADDDPDSPVITLWQGRTSLENSGPADCHFVVTVGEDGAVLLHFGDGVHGRRPPPGAIMIATYRLSQSGALTIGRDRIAYMVTGARLPADVLIKPRNLLPARAANALFGWPTALHCQAPPGAGCAVHAHDYAVLAERHRLVRQAAAWFSDSAGGRVVHVAIDRHEGELSNYLLRQQLEAALTPYLAARSCLRIAVVN